MFAPARLLRQRKGFAIPPHVFRFGLCLRSFSNAQRKYYNFDFTRGWRRLDAEHTGGDRPRNWHAGRGKETSR